MKNFGKLMKQAQKLQAEMARVRKELEDATVEGTAGGGVVKVVVNGSQEPVEVKIDPSVLEEDASMVEDLVLSALKEALENSRELMQSEMEKVTGDLGLPGGMPGGLF